MLNKKSRLEKALEKFLTPACKSEYAEQVAVMDWARKNEKAHPALEYLFHIPNGGHRSKVAAARLRRAGVKKGMPDLFLPYPTRGYHGLFVEMKKVKSGRASDEQLSIHAFLDEVGYASWVCCGAEQAKKVICNYLDIIL